MNERRGKTAEPDAGADGICPSDCPDGFREGTGSAGERGNREKYYSVEEVAEKAGVSRQTVYSWMKAEILRPETQSGRIRVSSEAAGRLLRRLIGWYLALNPENRGKLNEKK